ncbi:MAG: hypothetical protein R8J84_07680 [Mariprofundales bacterium]
MSRSAHQLLSKLAENDRTQQERALAELQKRRRQFKETRDKITDDIQKLGVERNTAMQHGSPAAKLTMIGGAIEEKLTIRLFLAQQIARLVDEEAIIIKAWTAASIKEKSHDSAHNKITRQQQRKADLRDGQQMEDLCSSSRRSRSAMEEAH